MGLFLPWAVTLAGVAGFVLLVPGVFSEFSSLLLSASSAWPVAVGALIAVGTWLFRQRLLKGVKPNIPEGDLLVPISRSLKYIAATWSGLSLPLWRRGLERVSLKLAAYGENLGRITDTIERAESRVQYWIVAGALALLLAILLSLAAALVV
jgi:hypothetical protein